jgi:beta-fructofuranosidase
MFERAGHHLGDIWTRVEGDRVHLFFLNCELSQERHTCWSIGHATSEDLMHWTDHGDIFHSEPTDPNRSCLSTGSVARFGDRYVMGFLANHNTVNPRVIYAESRDLMDWRLLASTGCDLQESGYGRRGSLPFKNPRWRDPFLFARDGWLHQLMTASDDTLPLEADGVVGHMRTRDLKKWEFLPPLQLPLLGTDLECPKVYRVGDQWVLLVSLFAILQSPAFHALQRANLNANTTYCLTASKVEGPYSFQGDARVLHHDVPGGPYACEAVLHRREWFLIGTCWSDRLGDRISDPIPLVMTPAGFRRRR